LGTEPEEFEPMPRGLETEALVYRFLRTLYLRIDEFDHSAALHTPEVVVMRMVVGVFVATGTVIAARLSGKPGVSQQLDGAEYSSLAYARVDEPGCLVHGIGTDMRLEAQEGSQHRIPRLRHLEAPALQVALKYRPFVSTHRNLPVMRCATLSIITIIIIVSSVNMRKFS